MAIPGTLRETIYARNGKIPLLEYHKVRLRKGLDYFARPDPDKIADSVIDHLILDAKLSDAKHTRLRLEYFLEDGHYIINIGKITWKDRWAYNSPVKLTVYRDKLKQFQPWQNLKTSDREIYEEALAKAKQKEFDDAIILNEDSRVVETCRCNIWWVKNGQLFTPSLSEGPVEGTWRSLVMEKYKGSITESSVSVDELLSADEVIVTNAIGGPMQVCRIDEKRFRKNTVFKELKRLAKDFLSANS